MSRHSAEQGSRSAISRRRRVGITDGGTLRRHERSLTLFAVAPRGFTGTYTDRRSLAQKPDLCEEYGRPCQPIGAGIAACSPLPAEDKFVFEEQHYRNRVVSIHVIISRRHSRRARRYVTKPHMISAVAIYRTSFAPRQLGTEGAVTVCLRRIRFKQEW